jgi:hypothetical protein
MARIAKRTQTAPYRLTVNGVDQWLCPVAQRHDHCYSAMPGMTTGNL